MAIPFLNNVDFGWLELLNLRLQNLGSAPAGAAGRVYFNTNGSANRITWHDGSSWQEIYPSATTNTANTDVRRDGSGNFSAGTITAALSGNATTATTLQTSRDFSVTGKATASAVSFNGSANVALSITALSVVPGDIALANGSFIVGNGSNVGAATAKSSIPISGFGAATANIDIGTTANGWRITNLANPVNAQDAATKAYVDSVSLGLDIKPSVRVATAAALPSSTYSSGTLRITASGTGVLVVDGVTVNLNDRLLVKNQATQSQNGLYYVLVAGDAYTPWVLQRSEDFDTSAEASPGSFTFVEEGTANADTGWVMTANAPVTLDTTNITWAQFSGAGSITAGNGIVQSGTSIHFAQSGAYTSGTVPYATSGTAIGFTSAPTGGQLLIGNASGVPTFTSLSGDATLSNAGALTIAASAVTFAKFQTIAGLSVVGNSSNATGTTAAITAGADFNVLRRSGTAVGFGSIDLSQSGAVGTSVLGAANGGTGQSTYATGDLLVGNGGVLSRFAIGAVYNVLKSTGTTISWGKVDMANEVSGILPAGNGGTGNGFFAVSGPATSTKTFAFKNQNGNVPLAFAAQIAGNGATTSFTVTHNLNTQDVVVLVYQSASPFAQVFTDIEMATVNTVTVRFAVAPTNGTNYRVVVVGF